MKEFYFSLVAVIMVTTTVANTTHKPCVYVPECPSKNNDSYTVHVPYKQDCHKFYKCNNKCGYLMDCPMMDGTEERLVFNPVLQVCDWPDDVPEGTCSNSESSPTLPTQPSSPTLPTQPSSPTLPTQPSSTFPPSVVNCSIPRNCPARGKDKFIHEKDCRKYYICLDGNKDPVPKECQEGHVFNPQISECDVLENTKCYRTDTC